jgi:hypothetical protein
MQMRDDVAQCREIDLRWLQPFEQDPLHCADQRQTSSAPGGVELRQLNDMLAGDEAVERGEVDVVNGDDAPGFV